MFKCSEECLFYFSIKYLTNVLVLYYQGYHLSRQNKKMTLLLSNKIVLQYTNIANVEFISYSFVQISPCQRLEDLLPFSPICYALNMV